MKVRLKFFASLRELSGIGEQEVECSTGINVAQLWNEVLPTQEMPANTLAAVNMEYVSLQHPVNEGDEVAFFPPVTGG